MDTGDDTSGVRVFPPLVYLIAVGIGFLVQRLIPLKLGTDWRVSEQVLGAALVGLGLISIFSAAMVFRQAGTTPNPTKPTTAFVVRGPFRFTRNPMYLGLTLVSIGIGLAYDAIWVVVLALAAAIVIQKAVIDREEPYLERKFGSEYIAYKSRVRRWL
jgi:protein-S-isoprenylcysteine O-methyltransferase Ste14